MCGRYVLFNMRPPLPGMEGVEVPRGLEPSYNIPPTTKILAARFNPGSGQPEYALLRWGLVPSWAKDPAIGARMFNARAETLASKPSFRSALKDRRCRCPIRRPRSRHRQLGRR